MSATKYGYSRGEHGSQRNLQELIDRAQGIGLPQGHFSDNRLIEEAFTKAPATSGVHIVTVSKESMVYYPNGTSKSTNVVQLIKRLNTKTNKV